MLLGDAVREHPLKVGGCPVGKVAEVPLQIGPILVEGVQIAADARSDGGATGSLRNARNALPSSSNGLGGGVPLSSSAASSASRYNRRIRRVSGTPDRVRPQP